MILLIPLRYFKYGTGNRLFLLWSDTVEYERFGVQLHARQEKVCI
jgi:hypothetical protein